MDLDRERDLDLERREPSLERAGERLADLAEPQGDALLEPLCESWADKTFELGTHCKQVHTKGLGGDSPHLTIAPYRASLL